MAEPEDPPPEFNPNWEFGEDAEKEKAYRPIDAKFFNEADKTTIYYTRETGVDKKSKGKLEKDGHYYSELGTFKDKKLFIKVKEGEEGEDSVFLYTFTNRDGERPISIYMFHWGGNDMNTKIFKSYLLGRIILFDPNDKIKEYFLNKGISKFMDKFKYIGNFKGKKGTIWKFTNSEGNAKEDLYANDSDELVEKYPIYVAVPEDAATAHGGKRRRFSRMSRKRSGKLRHNKRRSSKRRSSRRKRSSRRRR